MNSKIDGEFRATHTEFYSEFEEWRKASLKEGCTETGVYVLKANRRIGRLLKEDKRGILYIGKGLILPYHNRIGKFVNSLNNRENVHDGGNRFNMELIRVKYPLEDATIEITLTQNPDQLESKFLNEYYMEHGELPPFNRRLESNY